MVKPFRLTYLAKGGGCLTFWLLLTYRPILGLPEYKLKVVNICEMHGTGGREVVVFDRFQRYVEIVRKLMKKCYNSFIFQFNVLKSTGYRRKVIETTLQYQTFVCYW